MSGELQEETKKKQTDAYLFITPKEQTKRGGDKHRQTNQVSELTPRCAMS
jgi:hypothetical protein